MRRYLVPLTLVASFAAAAPGFAATEVGTIASVTPATDTIAFSDGETFTFPDDPGMAAALSQYHPGDVVAVAQNSAPDGSWTFSAIWSDNDQAGYAVP